MLPDKYGRNAVHLAADRYSSSILRLFLNCSTREFRRDYQGRSLLHYLAKWTTQEVLRAFCKAKHFIVDVSNRDRRTPLHYAALHSNFERALVLVEFGATIDAKDSTDFTALHYAVLNGNVKLVPLSARPWQQ